MRREARLAEVGPVHASAVAAHRRRAVRARADARSARGSRGSTAGGRVRTGARAAAAVAEHDMLAGPNRRHVGADRADDARRPRGRARSARSPAARQPSSSGRCGRRRRRAARRAPRRGAARRARPRRSRTARRRRRRWQHGFLLPISSRSSAAGVLGERLRPRRSRPRQAAAGRGRDRARSASSTLYCSPSKAASLVKLDRERRALEDLRRPTLGRRIMPAGGTTSLTSPIRWASSAPNSRPVSSRPIAIFNGTCRASRCTPPAPANRPTRGSGRPEAGVVGGDDDVARERELEPAAGGDAVDCGDQRLRAVEVARDAPERRPRFALYVACRWPCARP